MKKSLSLTTNKFIERANIVHNNRYDYSLSTYTNTISKIEIICPIHREFMQLAGNHLAGHGCPKCAAKKHSDSKLKTTAKFIQEANILHNNYYDYSLVDYKKSNKKIIIICPKHGKFLQEATSHLSGCGCPECASQRTVNSLSSNTNEFITRANIIHNYKYNYSLINYKNAHTKIPIICSTHGVFYQTPDKHLCGTSCPKCSNCISKPEIKWLDSLSIPNEYRQKILYISNKQIKTDAYNPNTNTIYEFWGDFWHGNTTKYNPTDINPINKKSYGELYEKTEAKRKLILSAGYNLIEIWESEWNKIMENK